MFFIGGIFTDRKNLDFRQTMICSHCGRYSSISVFMVYTCFSFFFIPLFKWGKKYYAVSNCCGAVFSIPKEKGEAIAKGEAVTLEEADLTPEGYEAGGGKCPDCGFPLTPDYEYCPKCGRKL